MNSLYKVSYSIGNQNCVYCDEAIETGHIEIAAPVTLPDDTNGYEWYHIRCLFENCLPTSEDEIEGFAALRINDRIAIREQLAPMTHNENTVIDLTVNEESDVDGQSAPERNPLKWNNGCAVDPLSEKDDYTHVYCERDELAAANLKKYSVTLLKVDVDKKENSFHRIQLLEANEFELYWIFESWGRVSFTEAWSTKTTSYKHSLNEAKRKFEVIYREKTGNNFGTLCFKKWPNKFNQADVRIGSIDKSTLPNLPDPVNQLMKMMVDAKQKSNMPINTNPNANRIPLGSPTVNQIHAAMEVLKEISKLITEKAPNDKLLEASNDFYSMIPHDFELEEPEIITYSHIVDVKIRMLQSLLNQYYIDCRDENTENVSIKALYQTLNVDINPLGENSGEFRIIRDAVQNTHAPMHDRYILEVVEIHKIKRHDEEFRFQANKDLGNHRLLWHGSRLENFVDILLHGLKIAPTGVQLTGSIFGQGIYFADLVSKSANYCGQAKTVDVGLLLLCEVARGESQKLYNRSSPMQGIPNVTYQSAMGVGATVPTQYTMIDGVNIASGGLHRQTNYQGLYHNEFIVYDPNQVKIKYLVKLKFNFRQSIQ